MSDTVEQMRHDPAQANPERLVRWYCPDCGKAWNVTTEVQRLQSRIQELESGGDGELASRRPAKAVGGESSSAGSSPAPSADEGVAA